MAETVLKALEMAILTGELKPRERLTADLVIERMTPEKLTRNITRAMFALRYNAYFLLGIAPKTLKDHETMIDAMDHGGWRDA